MSRRIKYVAKGKHQTRPVKDKKQVNEILYYLLAKRDRAKQRGNLHRSWLYDRNYMLVLIGFNTAFRAEDLLQLKVKDLVHGHVCIKENKTGKTQVFNLRKELLEIIRDYGNDFFPRNGVELHTKTLQNHPLPPHCERNGNTSGR